MNQNNICGSFASGVFKAIKTPLHTRLISTNMTHAILSHAIFRKF